MKSCTQPKSYPDYGESWSVPVRRHILQNEEKLDLHEDKFFFCRKEGHICHKNSEYELTQVIVKQRKGFLNNILETEGFFQQMEVTVREKGRSSEEFKLLRDALYGMAAYLQFLDKGHKVGLAAEI